MNVRFANQVAIRFQFPYGTSQMSNGQLSKFEIKSFLTLLYRYIHSFPANTWIMDYQTARCVQVFYTRCPLSSVDNLKFSLLFCYHFESFRCFSITTEVSLLVLLSMLEMSTLHVTIFNLTGVICLMDSPKYGYLVSALSELIPGAWTFDNCL